MQHQPNDRIVYPVRRRGKAWLAFLPAERTFDDEGLPYVVNMTVGLLNDAGDLGCTRLEVLRRPGGPPVGSQRIRTLPLRELEDLTLTSATATHDEAAGGGWFLSDEQAPDLAAATTRRRPGSPPVPDETLRLALAIHTEATDAGRRDALKFTREQLAERHGIYGQRSTVHSWIQKAKEAGFDGQR